MEPQEDEWFTCTFCAYKCADQALYNQHYVKKHRREAEFSVKCSLCLKGYNNLESLKSHLIRHHGISKLKEYLSVGERPGCSDSISSFLPTLPEVTEGNSEHAASGSGIPTSSTSGLPPASAELPETDHTQKIQDTQIIPPSDDSDVDDFACDSNSSGSEDGHKDSDESEETTAPHKGEDQESLLDIRQSAKFLLRLREEALVSQSAVDKTVDGVDELFANYTQTIKEHLIKGLDPKTGSISEEHIISTFEKFEGNGLFTDLDSKKKLDSFAKEYCNFIPPQKVELYKTEYTDKKGKIKSKSHCAYVCQFLPGLKRLLTRPDVLECIDNPLEHTEGVYRTYQDGSNARTHPILSDPKNLGIQLCYDDLEISSPLGPTKHKLSIYYWTLANIHPHLRASLRAISIAAIVNHSELTQYKSTTSTPFISLDNKYHVHCKILEPFLSDIKLLEKGIVVDINKEEKRMFKGTLQSVTGDTPAVAVLGGFKESVGPAHKPCHLCLVDHHEMKVIFNEDFYEKRTEENRDRHLQSVLNAATVQERLDNSTSTGYNGPSCIVGLQSFNQISCFLYDSMHIIMEGVLPAHMRVFLDFCVNDKHLYTIQEINDKVKSLSVHLSSADRPAPIKIEHLKSNLRQSASQMLRLATFLPIFMADKPELEERLSNFTLLLRISYGLLCYEVTDAEIKKLKTMIQVHHEKFMVDYPAFDITPKFHYMIHLPSQIKEFGPARYTWSMRYESMHSYIKNIMRIIKNFKNPPKSCTFRYEALRASQMLTFQGEKTPNFLIRKDTFSGVKSMMLKNHPFCHILAPLLGSQRLSIKVCEKVISQGVTFSVGSVVLLRRDKPPTFGEIEGIVRYGEITLLVNRKLQCEHYSSLSNTFTVITPPTPAYEACFIENLAFFRPLLKVIYKQSTLVVPKYHNLVMDYADY